MNSKIQENIRELIPEKQLFMTGKVKEDLLHCTSIRKLLENYNLSEVIEKTQKSQNFKDSKILIYQYGDAKQISDHQWWIQSVESYARYHNYAYIIDSVENIQALMWVNTIRNLCLNELHGGASAKLQGLKQFMIFNLLNEVYNSGYKFEYVLYLDLDIYVSQRNTSIEELLAKSSSVLPANKGRNSNGISIPCFLLVQEISNVFNTGVLAFSATTDHKDRIEKIFNFWFVNWLKLAGIWDGDQIAYAYSLLNEANDYNGISKEDRLTYESCRYGDAHGANLCIDKFFSSLHLNRYRRSFADFCIVGYTERNLRFNVHNSFASKDMFFHGHDTTKFKKVMSLMGKKIN